MKFLVDGMLGRLARWLRIMGYDTAYHPNLQDQELACIARAQGRVLLTRDTELVRRKGIRCLLIEDQGLEDQIRQVFQELQLSPRMDLPRCTVCNASLEEASADEVRGRVPLHIARTQKQFRRCPQCNRVYWAGTHVERMREQMEGFKLQPPLKATNWKGSKRPGPGSQTPG